jgi:hypothetical protein
MSNRNFKKNVLMGNGIIKQDGVFDMGYLQGKTEVNFTYDIEKFKEGAPLVLIGQETKECTFELKAGVAEFSPENASIQLGGIEVITTGTPQTVSDGSNQQRTFGGNFGGSGYQYISLDGPAVTGLVLKNLDEDVTYVENVDYMLFGVLAQVIRLPGGDIAEGETVRVHYGYTQVAGKQINLGSSFDLEFGETTFVHPRSKWNKKKITVHMYKSQASGNINFGFEDGKFGVNECVWSGIYSEEHGCFGYVHWED